MAVKLLLSAAVLPATCLVRASCLNIHALLHGIFRA